MKKKDKNGKKPSGRQMKSCDRSSTGRCQYNIQEDVVDQKKVKEKDVFDKGTKKKVPKGSHRMPDGSIMKDKDMKSTRRPKKTRRPKNQKY